MRKDHLFNIEAHSGNSQRSLFEVQLVDKCRFASSVQAERQHAATSRECEKRRKTEEHPFDGENDLRKRMQESISIPNCCRRLRSFPVVSYTSSSFSSAFPHHSRNYSSLLNLIRLATENPNHKRLSCHIAPFVAHCNNRWK